MVLEKSIPIETVDGVLINCHVFSPATELLESRTSIIINAALGIKSSFYRKFSTFLAQNGYHVFTYDYRGTPSSPDNTFDEPDLNDWAAKDFKAVLNYCCEDSETEQVFVCGHSIGGAILGLTSLPDKVKKIVLVGTQDGYWKLWPDAKKYLILFLSKVAVPVISAMAGRIPGKLFGLTIDIPKGVARDWAQWASSSDFLKKNTKRKVSFEFDTIKCPILWYSMDDDVFFAPKSAVDNMVKFFSNASIKRVHLIPDKHGIKKISHLGVFSKECEGEIWQNCLKWLDSGA